LEHIPVLAQAVTDHATFGPAAVVVDATLGQGGHSRLLGERLAADGLLIGLDVDPQSLAAAEANLKDLPCRRCLRLGNFANLACFLQEEGVGQVDFILADLGYSSSQLADVKAGLSFQTAMPLDMRLDKTLTETAADIVNGADEKSLADLIYQYGEDRASRRIARFIVTARKQAEITTTEQLAKIVARALYRPGKRRGPRLHPATRTFQALRIAVNRELDNLQQLLRLAPQVLRPEGRLAVISFHSLEDRLVKYDFKEKKLAGLYKILTKKPLVADDSEVGLNRRSRSAKLRIAERV
jgi:16S rRNA (cytosine1402-N4)-methyltransferase